MFSSVLLHIYTAGIFRHQEYIILVKSVQSVELIFLSELKILFEVIAMGTWTMISVCVECLSVILS